MLYAVYIVMIKRKVDREDKLDIPMFFGKTMFNLWGYVLWMITLGFRFCFLEGIGKSSSPLPHMIL